MGQKNGRCVICGTSGKLTKDHVPPQSVMPDTYVEVHKLIDVFDLRGEIPQGWPSRRSAFFYTLCAECNNKRLGSDTDPALAEFANRFGIWVKMAINLNLSLPKEATVKIKPAKVAKAVIGHLLAAERVRESREELLEGTMIQAMREYFLSHIPQMPEGLRVYVWPYPSDTTVIGRGIGFRDLRTPSAHVMDVLKFFPVAFGVAHNDDVQGLPRLAEISTSSIANFDDEVDIKIPLRGIPLVTWPERPNNHSFVLMNDQHVMTVRRKR